MSAELSGSWLSDRLHPILVRDIKQAVRGRVYAFAMTVACLSVVTVGLLAADRGGEVIELARWILVASLQCLAPLLLFAIPLMAFLSLREEVTEQAADQLMLTGMRPLSVITGMLLAAGLQALLFLSMFVPLLGFSYLLLGVDIFTLLQTAWLSLLGSILATTAAFALVRLRRFVWLREYVALGVVVALGWASVHAVTRADELLTWMEANARASDFWLRAFQQWTVFGLAIVSCALLGAGSLTHVQEFRATSFRILGIVAAPTLTLLFGGGMRGAGLACFALFPFWFLAVTDPLALSPRHRALVPRARGAALRMLPLLPGSARGLIYTALLAVVVLTSGLATHIVFLGELPSGDAVVLGLLGCEYMLAYACVYCFCRNRRFEQNRVTTVVARARLPGATIMAWLGLIILDGLLTLALTGSARRPLFLLSMLNPVWQWGSPYALPRIWAAAVLAAIIVAFWMANMPELRSSVREVLAGEKQPLAGRRSRRSKGRRRRRS